RQIRMFIIDRAWPPVIVVIEHRRLTRTPIVPGTRTVYRVHAAELFDSLAQRILFFCHRISIPARTGLKPCATSAPQRPNGRNPCDKVKGRSRRALSSVG